MRARVTEVLALDRLYLLRWSGRRSGRMDLVQSDGPRLGHELRPLGRVVMVRAAELVEFPPRRTLNLATTDHEPVVRDTIGDHVAVPVRYIDPVLTAALGCVEIPNFILHDGQIVRPPKTFIVETSVLLVRRIELFAPVPHVQDVEDGHRDRILHRAEVLQDDRRLADLLGLTDGRFVRERELDQRAVYISVTSDLKLVVVQSAAGSTRMPRATMAVDVRNPDVLATIRARFVDRDDEWIGCAALRELERDRVRIRALVVHELALATHAPSDRALLREFRTGPCLEPALRCTRLLRRLEVPHLGATACGENEKGDHGQAGLGR